MLSKEMKFATSTATLIVFGIGVASGDPDKIGESNDVAGGLAKMIQPTTDASSDAAMAVTVGQTTIISLEDKLLPGRPTDPTSGWTW